MHHRHSSQLSGDFLRKRKAPIRPHDLQSALDIEQYSLARLIARTGRTGLVLRLTKNERLTQAGLLSA